MNMTRGNQTTYPVILFQVRERSPLCQELAAAIQMLEDPGGQRRSVIRLEPPGVQPL